MSRSLNRWGRFAARRPWVVIGAWLVVSVLVLGGSATFGDDLEDTFSAPGVDSQKATELMARAGSDQRGLTAQVVVTPADEQATFHSSADRAGGPRRSAKRRRGLRRLSRLGHGRRRRPCRRTVGSR